MLLAVKKRAKLASKAPCLHGSKRETAALTPMHERIAPTLPQGCVSPVSIRPQPALDPATGRLFVDARKHFSGLEKTLRQNYALFDRHSQRVVEQQGMLLPRCAVIVEYADVLETVTAFATIADPPHDSFPS